MLAALPPPGLGHLVAYLETARSEDPRSRRRCVGKVARPTCDTGSLPPALGQGGGRWPWDESRPSPVMKRSWQQRPRKFFRAVTERTAVRRRSRGVGRVGRGGHEAPTPSAEVAEIMLQHRAGRRGTRRQGRGVEVERTPESPELVRPLLVVESSARTGVLGSGHLSTSFWRGA